MNNRSRKSLRRQFILRILLLLVAILALSGAVQGDILRNKLNSDTTQQASMIGQSVQQGISETDLASKNIEHQIDLKLASYDMRIGDRLQGRTLNDITTEDLTKLRDEMGVAGITLIAYQKNDFVNVKSTDPNEIGFSWKKVGPAAFNGMMTTLHDGVVPAPLTSYSAKGIMTLFAAQSGTHKDKPVFYKYSYYHAPGTDYIIDAYIQASEVYNFTQAVGPDRWIQEVLSDNPYAKEIAVLDPRVFADPSLAKRMYPPLKQVVNGDYELRSHRDVAMLKAMANHPSQQAYVDQVNGQSLYKMFIPIDQGRVIYIALDYNKLSAPLYNYSIMLIVFGFISLIALFLLTASFFTKIYRNIQQIIAQIKQLEAGDLTAKSDVAGGGELGELSESTNKMADSLNRLLMNTQEKATQAQRLSVLLEHEANESVEKAFTMSMESTSQARESAEEAYYFLDAVEEQLQLLDSPESKDVLDKLDSIRDVVKKRSANTTAITITLSDLFKSLHGQSSELSELSNSLLEQLAMFKLSNA